MIFIRYPQYSAQRNPSVVTIGNFDGIHKGHQTLIKKVVNYAGNNNLQSIVITMQPLAFQYFNSNNDTAILTPFKCKYDLVKLLGVDQICVLNFNKNLANYSPKEFIQKILINGLCAKHIIIGDDFKFGKNRAGDLMTLKQYCEPLGVSIDSMSTVLSNRARISSSQIRRDLANSDFQSVTAGLGRRFSIVGKVSKGQQLGRELNFPTINIKLGKRLVPIQGVFCVTVKFNNGFEHIGAASIGTRPTVNGTTNLLEVHIIDFNKQVYGQNVEVLFHHKLRNEVKFESLDELKKHIYEDVQKTRLFFNNYRRNMESLREQ